MKLGVISDIHGSLTAFNEATNFLSDSDLILVAGDILYHGARNPLPEGYDTAGVVEKINQFSGNLLMVKGNVDALVDDWVLPYPLPEHSIIDDNGRRIVIYHGYQHQSETERIDFANRFGADILIYGHTHFPKLKKVKDLILLNPGSISLPKQESKQSTLAIIDETKVELIDLTTKEVLTDLEI